MKQISKKRAAALRIYNKLRKEFLVDKICPVTGQPATEIHHMKSRGVNLNKTEFWLAVSRDGHQKIEMNPAWAKKMGYSLSRI